jgi:hypothetical protein
MVFSGTVILNFVFIYLKNDSSLTLDDSLLAGLKCKRERRKYVEEKHETCHSGMAVYAHSACSTRRRARRDINRDIERGVGRNVRFQSLKSKVMKSRVGTHKGRQMHCASFVLHETTD